MSFPSSPPPPCADSFHAIPWTDADWSAFIASGKFSPELLKFPLPGMSASVRLMAEMAFS